jgi:hypothetical protein
MRGDCTRNCFEDGLLSMGLATPGVWSDDLASIGRIGSVTECAQRINEVNLKAALRMDSTKPTPHTHADFPAFRGEMHCIAAW